MARIHVSPLVFVLSLLLFGSVLRAQDPVSGGPDGELLTPAERSGFARTSTHAEVQALIDKIIARAPVGHMKRIRIGSSEKDRSLDLVAVSNTPWGELPKGSTQLGTLATQSLASGKLRVLVQANIHGGEVEGKEAALILLRELAQGRHAELLKNLQIFVLPLYNADGNDAIDPKNRVSQNGPVEGVGLRPNADGLDLNRDFIKAESRECRSLLNLYRRLDPHLMMDLHTTNGSRHGYHLTYAPCLSPNQDSDLARFATEMQMPEIRRELYANHLFRSFDYGNYSERRLEAGWRTFDHRPRFATNYYGLRNRLAVLSEAYSYQPFEVRVRATRAFVLENLRFAHRQAKTISALCAQADARAAGTRLPRPSFPSSTRLATGPSTAILTAELERLELEGLGARLRVKPGFKAVEMPAVISFEAQVNKPLPRGWIITRNTKRVLQDLAHHGVEYRSLAGEKQRDVEVYEVIDFKRAKRPFQNHRPVILKGAYARRKMDVPLGSLFVPATQPLARLAAQLLEPVSEDSLTTWNRFDATLEHILVNDSAAVVHPVWRVVD
jgi:Zinc carboxypeptidase